MGISNDNVGKEDNSDYITILKTPKPCNKVVSVDANGNLSKKPASNIYKATARTVHVPDLQSFESSLRELANKTNLTMVLGYVPGTENGDTFTILTAKDMGKKLGTGPDKLPSGIQEIDGKRYVTRQKANFHFSSWTLFDYDRVKGMPAELETNSTDEWRQWLCNLIPGLSAAGMILTPSTTSRVIRDGSPAYDNGGWHAYIQVNDAEDVERFGRELLIRSMGTPYGFMRPIYSHDTGEVIAHRPWMITDPTTFSPERLVFDGKPVVNGTGLSIAEPDIRVIDGKRLETSSVRVAEDTTDKVREKTGLTLSRERHGSGYKYMLVNEKELKLKTAVVVENGRITVEEYWSSGKGKLRAQAVFRPDSKSWAAYLGKHKDGTPFLFDVGTHTKFVLDAVQKDHYLLNKAKEWLKSADCPDIKAYWTEHCKLLPDVFRDEFRHLVNQKTGFSLSALSKQLRAAEKDWTRASAEERTKELMQERKEQGRPVSIWSDDKLNNILRETHKRLLLDTARGLVMNFGGQLVHVIKGPPSSVRQVLRKASMGENYPDQYITQVYTPTTMMMRVLDTMTFINRKGKLIGCPPRLAQALIDAPTFAPPLLGLLEVPTICPDGVLMSKPGYDHATGFYGVFHPSLGASLLERATREDAIRALDYLKGTVFADFPFNTGLDYSAAVAMLVTAFVCRFMRKTPGFMITATTQASGKSTLADIVFQAAYGRPAAAASWTDDQDEMRKVLISILMEGQSGICFDNAPFGHRIDGDELAKLISQESYEGRILGVNKTLRAPANVLTIITGNQLAAVNDMATRLLPITLCPDTDRPEQRKFSRRHIDDWHEDHRQEIVCAVCTILLAWHQEGKGNYSLPNQSRFSEWDECVRAPLLWLGLQDFNKLFEDNRAEDPVCEERSAFLKAWHERYADRWVNLNDLLAEHWPSNLFGDPHTDLGKTMSPLCKNERPDARHLGNNFRYFKDAVYDGFKLTQKTSSSSSKKSRPWRVVRVDGGSGGHGGSSGTRAETKRGDFQDAAAGGNYHCYGQQGLEKTPQDPLDPPKRGKSALNELRAVDISGSTHASKIQ